MSEADWSKIWDVYDHEIKRVLPKSTVATIMRACGRLLLKDQMDNLLKRFTDPMSKQNFLEAMNESVSGEPKEKNLLTALQAFDVKEQNDLSRLEIQQMLTNMNEKLTKEQFDMLMENFTGFKEGDRANIDDFFAHLKKPVKQIAKKNIEIKGGGGGGGGGAPASGGGEPDPFGDE